MTKDSTSIFSTSTSDKIAVTVLSVLKTQAIVIDTTIEPGTTVMNSPPVKTMMTTIYTHSSETHDEISIDTRHHIELSTSLTSDYTQSTTMSKETATYEDHTVVRSTRRVINAIDYIKSTTNNDSHVLYNTGASVTVDESTTAMRHDCTSFANVSQHVIDDRCSANIGPITSTISLTYLENVFFIRLACLCSMMLTY